MIHNERVRQMTHLQAFEDHKGKEEFPIMAYFCRDYVGLHLLKAFFYGTICYGIMLGIWGVTNMIEIMGNIHTMDLKQLAIDILLRYIAFEAIYMLCVFIYAQSRYNRAKKNIKKYGRRLKKVLRSYERDGGES